MTAHASRMEEPAWPLVVALVVMAIGVAISSVAAGLRPLYGASVLLLLLILSPHFYRRPQDLVVLLATWTPMGLVGRIEVGGGLPLLHSLLHVVGLVLAGIWAASFLFGYRRLRLGGTLLAVLAVVFLAGVVSLWSDWPGNSLSVLARYYVPFLGLAFLIQNVTDSPTILRRAAAGLTLGIALMAVSMIFQAFGWIDPEGVNVNELGRKGSLGGGIASMSLYVVIAAALSLTFAQAARGRVRLGWILVLGVLVSALAQTVSLTAISTLAVVLLLGMTRLDRGIVTAGFDVLTRAVPIAVLMVTVLFATTPLLAYRALGKWQDLATESVYLWGSGRVGLTLAGIWMIADHPLAGVGVGNAGLALVPYAFRVPAQLVVPIKEGVPVKVPDNTAVEVFSEFGLALGSLFVVALGVAAFRLQRRLSAEDTPEEERTLLRGLLLAFFGAVLFSFFNDVMTDKVFWMLLALIFAAETVRPRESPRIAGGPHE